MEKIQTNRVEGQVITPLGTFNMRGGHSKVSTSFEVVIGGVEYTGLVLFDRDAVGRLEASTVYIRNGKQHINDTRIIGTVVRISKMATMNLIYELSVGESAGKDYKVTER